MAVKTLTIAVGLTLCLMGMACSTAPKPIVNQPLKLSGPQDAKTYSCGKTGCEGIVNTLCGDKPVEILDKNFVNDNSSTKNHHTGQFTRNRNHKTQYVYRCAN